VVMPPSGTFDYVAIAPERPLDASHPWTVALREPLKSTGDRLHDSRLLGIAPTLEVRDAGLTPNAGFTHGVWRPEVMRTRLTLRASERERSTVSAASFFVDTSLVSRVRSGDLLYMVRTPCAGLALSVVRQGRLVAAVGAVTRIPLGDNVVARIPSDLITEAEAAFRTRDSAFELPELPIEFAVGGDTFVSLRSRRTLGGYHVSIQHGFYRGTPGIDESVAIADVALCPDTAANASAILLAADDIDMLQW